MGYADIIAREVQTLPQQKQAEVLDYIAFLKTRQTPPASLPPSQTADGIEAFFRSFGLDLSGYRFDRADANAR